VQRPRWEAATWRWGGASTTAGVKMQTRLRPVLHSPACPWDPKSQAFVDFVLDSHRGWGLGGWGGCAAEGEVQAMGHLHAQGARLSRAFALLI